MCLAARVSECIGIDSLDEIEGQAGGAESVEGAAGSAYGGWIATNVGEGGERLSGDI